jgi:hypothetical protein
MTDQQYAYEAGDPILELHEICAMFHNIALLLELGWNIDGIMKALTFISDNFQDGVDARAEIEKHKEELLKFKTGVE